MSDCVCTVWRIPRHGDVRGWRETCVRRIRYGSGPESSHSKGAAGVSELLT